MANLETIRANLTPEDIKNILFKYEVYPYSETEESIVFPTCCHNLYGGSPKLYYYTNSHLFVCYTHCSASFDIFELLIKMEKLRGRDITLNDALKIAGIEEEIEQSQEKIDDMKSLEYLKRLYNLEVPIAKQLNEINNQAMAQFVDNPKYLEPWINEGMSIESLRRFGIKYDMANLAIVIPHRDKTGKIVGVRGRFMEEGTPNKYMPLTYCGNYLAHNLRDNLYGLYENREYIKKTKTVFIFESEKSVILMDTYMGKDKNCAVATCGNKISKEQMSLLREFGVTNVILCYDKDYKTYNEQLEVEQRYLEICKKLSAFFKTSLIMDYGCSLNYKDSPIDEGIDIFMELYNHRYYI